MASTKETLETPQVFTAPDDSDFIDSSSEADPDDQQIEQTVLSEPPHASQNDTTTCSTDENTPQPLHHLMPISRRLWFTYFNQPIPNVETLNQNNGREAAVFKSDDSDHKHTHFHWFNVDKDLVYLSFWDDWGPLNVAMFYRFCLHVHHLLMDEEASNDGQHLVLYTSNDPKKKANNALLAAMYAMVIDKISPADAFHPISQLEFRPFRDAGYGRPDFNLSIQDILYGVHRAINVQLLDLTTFNLLEYEHYEQVPNGDWNWITPNFIAFASPHDRGYVEALRVNGGRPPPATVFQRPKPNSTLGLTIQYFRERNVKLVVRLNNPLYDKAVFEDAGIQHADMYFDDGSNPSESILRQFISKADSVIRSGGVIAVHCKAGLGRTGVLIGAYLIWKHGFSASEAIGFMRFMRPGCVVGPQQHFMYENFVEWVRWSVHDNALKEAEKTIAAQREALLAKSGGGGVGGSNQVLRSSLKRPATPDDDDDHQQDSDGDKDDDKDKVADFPVTPRAKKIPHVVPASAVPAVKPTPCVGQPRKSPSPSRKRAAAQAPPATVARLELTSRSLGANRGGGDVGGRSGATRGLFGTRSFHTTMQLDTVPSTLPRSELTDSLFDVVEDGSVANVATSPLDSGRGSPTNVLMEAQRLNVQPVTTPTASAKNMVLLDTTTENVAEVLTPSPQSRILKAGHQRFHSVDVVSVTATAESTPTSPSGVPREKLFRASPDIRTRYQLKDVSTRSSPSSSPPPSPQKKVSTNGTTTTTNGDSEPAALSDAEVLGVIDSLPELKKDSTANTRTARANAAATATCRSDGKKDSKPTSHTTTTTTSKLVRPRSKASHLPTTTTTASNQHGPESLATARASSRLAVLTHPPSQPASSASSASLRTRTATQPAGNGTGASASSRPPSRPTVRPVSAASSTGMSNRLQEVRSRLKTASKASHTTAATTTTSASASARTASSVRKVSGTRPGSTLLAPTASSVARSIPSSTNLRKGRISPPVSGVGVKTSRSVSIASSSSSTSSSSSFPTAASAVSHSRLARNVKRRRSSMGEADVDVIA